MLTFRGKFIIVGIGILLILLLAYAVYSHFDKPPIEPIKDRSQTSLTSAVKDSTGVTLSDREGKELTEKVAKAWTRPPKYEAEVKSEREADNKAQELAKKDNADTVLKEKKQETSTETQTDPKTGEVKQVTTNKTIMQYTGVTLDKKQALGVYTDIDKSGSMGVYYRNDRTTLAVGKKFEDGGITARVSQDIIRW